jgi:1,4-alpha-glucan branching enzyme
LDARWDASSLPLLGLEARHVGGVEGQREPLDGQVLAPERGIVAPCGTGGQGAASVLSDYDLYLLGEGNHHRAYDCMGAHLVGEPRPGVRFVVWAPHARRVSVVGDFNGWDGGRHPMQRAGGFGLWAALVPEAAPGQHYKYRLETASGEVADRADPYAFAAELRPGTASVIHAFGQHTWGDGKWLDRRARTNPATEPLSIYEVHLGSWRRQSVSPSPYRGGGRGVGSEPFRADGFFTYRELAVQLVEYVSPLGYTHVELLPITEHPFDGSWGYQTTGYFAPTARYGSPDDFAWFVEYCHRHGIGVILDWVPGHFPRDAHALARFDGTALYECEDTRKGEHREWGTLIFNTARNEVRNFLEASALFWLDRYHVDGLRVDAVAAMLYLDFGRDEWEPNERGGSENLAAIDFLQRLNTLCRQYHPGAITIAEDSSLYPGVTRSVAHGGLGFTFKWNMGWMNDTLRYIATDPLFRKHEHEKLLIGLRDAYRERFILPISHDEVVHLKRAMLAKMPGDFWQQRANLRLYYAFMWTHPGKKLLFMGQEWGVWREWSEAETLDWALLQAEPHRQLQEFVTELNRLYRAEPALHEGDTDPAGFRWLEAGEWERSLLAYLRLASDPNDFLVVLCNFTPVPREEYRVGVPAPGSYEERLNSDAMAYGGSGIGNSCPIDADPLPCHGEPYSLCVTLPPLAVLVLKPTSPR